MEETSSDSRVTNQDQLECAQRNSKHQRSYRRIGNVIDLEKPRGGEESLNERRAQPTTTCISDQTITISGEQATRIAKLLLGPTSKLPSSIEVFIPECWVKEYPREHWDDMIDRFKPQNSIPRQLFIVQKVVLAPKIKIVDGNTDTVLFTISANQNQMLPIAFSGSKYSYDKFGNLESKNSYQVQHDTAGASCSHSEADDDEDEDKDEDEDDEDKEKDEDEDNGPANDVHTGDLLANSGDDWIMSLLDSMPTDNEIYAHVNVGDEDDDDDDPAGPPPSPPGSPPRNQQDSDLDDID